MIDQLIAALNQEVDLSAEEIADTLWLAMHMEQSGVDSTSRESSHSNPDQETTEDNSKQHSQADLADESPTETSTTEQESTEKEQPSDRAGVYNQQPDRTQKSLDIPFKVPDAPSLREQLDLARAVKPLMRRIPSGSSLILDEAATTQRIANEGIWLPVIKPTLEPWLDLELVVDEGISMQIWRKTIKELERLLKNYGIFRDVRVWGLISNEQHKIQIRRGIGATAKNQSPRSAAELIDSSGRRLVLVVSDCVSDIWRSGAVNLALQTWANNVPTAIIQMLPQWLWGRTALGRATEVRFQGLAPSVSNRQLIANIVSLWSEIDQTTGIKVPVFTLEPERVSKWAQMLVGKGSIQSSGFVFKPEIRNLERDKPLFSLNRGELTPVQRVQAFRVTASPMARKLAGLLASAPVISLPVVRLIRETMLPESQQVHVAEVFLGGLLKPLSEIEVDIDPGYVQYGFIDGVRELLVDSVPTSSVLNVVEEVSKFVAKKVGLSLEQFAAVLRNPEEISHGDLVKQVQPFAMVTGQILRRLGGEYEKVADELKFSSEHYQNRLSDKEVLDYIYEVNLFILGEPGSGKTSLAKKIADINYPVPNLEKSTEGIDIIEWHFKTEKGQDFRINIWDFGGQEIYNATHRFFLTKRSLYILVVDERKENTLFDYWLNIVELLSDNSPLLIIKNERDDRKREIDITQLKRRFDNIKDYFATNLATNRGLDDIIKAIQYYVSSLPHIGSALPKTWTRVRETLEKDARNYISLAEYLNICEENGLKKQEDKLQLSQFLHDIGVILHFQYNNRSLLYKTVILKPEWGTDAVYNVLDSKTVVNNFGRFTNTDLDKIWELEKYTNMQGELLELMMKFKLCYKLPETDNTYIAPQLLKDEQPDYPWDTTNNLLLRYSYDFMPRGILTQFIVIMHRYIEQQSYVWKRGVILKQRESRAEIIETYNHQEIKIRLSGTNRRDFLVNITWELDKIHESYNRLQVQKLIPCNCKTCKHQQNPHFYPDEVLQRARGRRQKEIQCQKSFEMVNVTSLIDEIFKKDGEVTTMIRNKIFISYSHQDNEWLKRLQVYLKPLEKKGLVDRWDDTKIKAGMKWREEIQKALDSAQIAILLVSSDFLASNFIDEVELPQLLKAAESAGALILSVILNPCTGIFDLSDLQEFQTVNSPSQPLSTMDDNGKDEIFNRLIERIVEVSSTDQ